MRGITYTWGTEMGQRVGSKLCWMGNGRYQFHCPGCEMDHQVNVEVGHGPVWGFNGSGDAPTFTPSILVTYDHMSEAGRQRNKDFYAEHGRYMTREELPYDEHHVCHSFVRDGMMEFLSDCTHKLAGQTVPLPDMDD